MEPKNYKLIYLLLDIILLLALAYSLTNNYIEPNLELDSNAEDIKINDIPVNDVYELEFLVDQHKIGDTVAVEYVVDHKLYKTSVILTPYYDSSLRWILLLTVFVYVIIAIYVIRARFADYVSRVFHNASFSVALLTSMTWCGLNHTSLPVDFLSRLLYDTAYLFLGINLLRFSLVFPREKKLNKSKLIPFLHVLILAIILIIAYHLIPSGKTPLDSFRDYWIIHQLVVIPVFIMLVLASLVMIFHSYVAYKGSIERQKIRWILIGLFIALFNFVFLWLIPDHTDLYKPFMNEGLMYLLTLPAPISIFIAIIKYRAFNIDFLISKTTLLAIFSTIIFGLYGLLLIIFRFENFNLTYMIVAAISVLIFNIFKKKIDALIERVLFREKFRQRQINEKYSVLINDSLSVKDAVEALYDFIKDSGLAAKFELTVADIEKMNVLHHKNGKELHLPFDYNELNKQLKNNPLYSDSKVVIADKNSVESDLKVIPQDITVFADSHYKLFIISISADRNLALITCLGVSPKRVKFGREEIDNLSVKTNSVINIIYKITMMKQIVEKDAENSRLTELNDLKSWFVSNVSHELKTPLTSIRLFSELLDTDGKPDAARNKEYLGVIQQECDRLTRKINNLLDFSKIEKGLKSYTFHILDLREIILHSLKILENDLAQNNFATETSFPEEKILINGDKDSLIEVFTNLISNSIKYSDEDKHISIKINNRGDMYNIIFEDKGIGIPAEDTANIFEPFFRVRNERTSNQSGTGIGLSIVKNIITSHNGSITAVSNNGRGTRFIIQLPAGEIK